jgi:hypothetical protein
MDGYEIHYFEEAVFLSQQLSGGPFYKAFILKYHSSLASIAENPMLAAVILQMSFRIGARSKAILQLLKLVICLQLCYAYWFSYDKLCIT